tara:strand:+ start:95 stop:394 length:300 start_codon:yes stop_codon:yes gene_type:complete
MSIIEKLSEHIAELISNASINKTPKPTILFCGCNPQVKKDMHKRAKSIGLSPAYSIKHPSIKVELKSNRKIETDKYRTITIGYEHFEFIFRYLESKKFS